MCKSTCNSIFVAKCFEFVNQKIKNMKYLISMLAITALVSCATPKEMTNSNDNSIQQKWELSVLDGKPITPRVPLYIELGADNKVSGFIGCNRLTGNYNVTNGTQLKFNQLGVTMMACAQADMDLEKQVLELLNTTDNFTISDGKLMLNVGRRAPLATFIKMSDNEIVNKYWKLIKLEGADVNMAANQEREQYFMLRSNGSISGFGGCNQFNGQYEIMNGKRVSLNKNMLTTLRACDDAGVKEAAFLKVFELADNYTLVGETLSLNVGKRAPLAVFEAVYF